MVKFKIGVEDLKRVVNSALNSFDANIDINLKQIVFKADEAEQQISVAAYSYLMSFYTKVPAEIETDGIFTLGLEISDIVNVCATKNENTAIEYIEFEEQEKFVKVTADERGKPETPFENYENALQWLLPKTPDQRVLKYLNFDLLDYKVADDVEELDINNMKFILDVFTPLLTKGEIRQPSAYLYFSKEYIYCVNGSTVSYNVNIFDKLHDINLNSKVLSYLKVLLTEATETSSLFLFSLDNKMVVMFDTYVVVYNLPKMKTFSIDHYLEERKDGFIISMEMLTNIIRRGMISDKTLRFEMSDGNLIIKNTKESTNSPIKFNSTIPILKQSCEDIGFSVDLEMLLKAILQDQGKYALLYGYKANGVKRIKLTDEAKTWYSDIPVGK
jgi:hypothetical protein